MANWKYYWNWNELPMAGWSSIAGWHRSGENQAGHWQEESLLFLPVALWYPSRASDQGAARKGELQWTPSLPLNHEAKYRELGAERQALSTATWSCSHHCPSTVPSTGWLFHSFSSCFKSPIPLPSLSHSADNLAPPSLRKMKQAEEHVRLPPLNLPTNPQGSVLVES